MKSGKHGICVKAGKKKAAKNANQHSLAAWQQFEVLYAQFQDVFGRFMDVLRGAKLT